MSAREHTPETTPATPHAAAGGAAGPTREAGALIDAYFARVHGALLLAAASGCEETVEDLRTHVLDELAGTSGSAADVQRVLAELGSPEELAALCAGAVADEPTAAEEPGEERSLLSGRVLGVPYELRVPTAERVVSRWWDPVNPRVFVQRVFGIGWDVNFGAVAVRLGLVRPDDEDAPFASVPPRYLSIALIVPLTLAAALVLLVALYQGALPAQVAVHYGITGADRFASKESALVIPVVMTLLGLLLVAYAWVRRRPPLVRVGAGALATLLAGISVSAYAQDVVTAHSASETSVLLPGLALSVLLTFGLLVTLSRIGRAVEVGRDLKKSSKKGSV
jgi:hypothetical protein